MQRTMRGPTGLGVLILVAMIGAGVVVVLGTMSRPAVEAQGESITLVARWNLVAAPRDGTPEEIVGAIAEVQSHRDLVDPGSETQPDPHQKTGVWASLWAAPFPRLVAEDSAKRPRGPLIDAVRLRALLNPDGAGIRAELAPATGFGDAGGAAMQSEDATVANRPLSGLSARAVEVIEMAPGPVSVAVIDLRRGDIFEFEADRPFRLASVGKLALMLAALEAQPTEQTQDLVWRMITTSENAAANLLWERTDRSAGVAAVWERLGLRQAVTLDRHWGGVATGAGSIAMLLATIAGGSPEDAGLAIAQRALEGIIPAHAWGVSAGLPPSHVSGLKNGWAELETGWLVHSSGYVRHAGGTPLYAVAILTFGAHTLRDGITLIESIAAPLNRALVPATAYHP